MRPSEWLARRFWGRVDRSDPFGCWLWTGGRTNYEQSALAYGCISFDKTTYRAHRIAWMITYGSTRGLFVCHKCDVALCVNPHHLYLGTRDNNRQDAIARGRYEPAWCDEEGWHDVRYSTSVPDLVLDEDIRAWSDDPVLITAQRKRFDFARMLSDRNIEIGSESNGWMPPDPCELRIPGSSWVER